MRGSFALGGVIGGLLLSFSCGEGTSVAPAVAPTLDAGDADSSGPDLPIDTGGDTEPPSTDASSDAADAGEENDGGPRTITAIFGTLEGVCPALTKELASASPSYFENTLTFAAGETYARSELSPGGQTLYDALNVGGSSVTSEILAYEALHFCEGAELYKTETQVAYDTASKRADFVVNFGTRRIGVSVTRAFPFPLTEPPRHDALLSLVTKKLGDIQLATASVSTADRWDKQVLSIIAWDSSFAAVLRDVVKELDANTLGDTIIVVTETDGDDEFIYSDD